VKSLFATKIQRVVRGWLCRRELKRSRAVRVIELHAQDLLAHKRRRKAV